MRLAGTVAAVAWLAVATCQVQLPCDSPLRGFPSLAMFFRHCECVYGEWTDAAPVPNSAPTTVPAHQCRSELAMPAKRWQLATSGYECENITEETYICLSTCRYSNWTDAVSYVNATTPIRVPRYQCPSEIAFQGERWQIAIAGYQCTGTQCKECEDLREETYMCKPSIAEQMIVLFQLGNRGQNNQRDQVLSVDNFGSGLQSRQSNGADLFRYDKICSSRRVCPTQQGQRSVYRHKETKVPHVKEQHLSLEPTPLPVDPIPFDIMKHSTRYRRHNSDVSCYHGTRYVLFLLDTSGSIGPDDFNIMTSALSTLVHYFCSRIKVAAMTFSDEHFIEFCFDCFDNDCRGRDKIRNAMKAIRYRGGWIHTGQATQCACDDMLSPKYGFPNVTELSESDTVCLDVVYVTDGQSNGPQYVCQKVQCLYDLIVQRVELKVYAIGVDDYNIDELNCIARPLHVDPILNPIFRVESFEKFANETDKIVEMFAKIESPADSGPYELRSPPETHTCITSYRYNHNATENDTNDCKPGSVVPQ